jgi:hypothetical protein
LRFVICQRRRNFFHRSPNRTTSWRIIDSSLGKNDKLVTSAARDSCLRLNWRARRSESDSERLRSLAVMRWMDGWMGPLALLCEYERAAFVRWLAVVAQEAFSRRAHVFRRSQKIAIHTRRRRPFFRTVHQRVNTCARDGRASERARQRNKQT